MTSTFSQRLACTFLVVSLAPMPALARAQTTIGLIHGLNSSSATWRPTAVRLMADMVVDTILPDLPWQYPYPLQEYNLTGPFDASSVVVGHSNGGIVSRLYAADDSLAGLVTWSSPNYGAPLVDHIIDLGDYTGGSLSDAYNVISNLTAFYAGIDALDAVEAPVDWLIDNVFYEIGYVADAIAYWTAPVIGEMSPGTPFLDDTLNTTAGVAAEESHVARVVSASFTPGNWYYGGMFQFLDYTNYVTITDYVYDAADLCDYWSFEVLGDDPGDDPDQGLYQYQASLALEAFSNDLLALDSEWCYAVTDDPLAVDELTCPPSDEIVPQSSADLSWAFAAHHFTPADGLGIHNQETQDYSDLESVLQEDFGVIRR